MRTLKPAPRRVLERLAGGDAIVSEFRWWLPDFCGPRRLTWLSDRSDVQELACLRRIGKAGLAAGVAKFCNAEGAVVREVIGITEAGRQALAAGESA